jgi:hypothetical protein
MRCRRLHLLRATIVVAVFSLALAAGNAAIAQTANSNARLEGGQDNLFDAILATPNRKTPVPRDNIFATAPGATQTAPASLSKRKVVPTPPVMNRTYRGERQ